MKKQRYARPDTPVATLPNGTAAQRAPAHTVPHERQTAGAMAAAVRPTAGADDRLPIPLTRELLERGRERFDIYCAVCHGADGHARGIVVRRGFPAPPPLHDDRLRAAPASYVVEVITQGRGLMASYADRVAPDDRWAIAAYVRALQLSQHALVRELSAEDRRRLEQP